MGEQTEQERERVFYANHISFGEGVEGEWSAKVEYLCRAKCSQQCWKVCVGVGVSCRSSPCRA